LKKYVVDIQEALDWRLEEEQTLRQALVDEAEMELDTQEGSLVVDVVEGLFVVGYKESGT